VQTIQRGIRTNPPSRAATPIFRYCLWDRFRCFSPNLTYHVSKPFSSAFFLSGGVGMAVEPGYYILSRVTSRSRAVRLSLYRIKSLEIRASHPSSICLFSDPFGLTISLVKSDQS